MLRFPFFLSLICVTVTIALATSCDEYELSKRCFLQSVAHEMPLFTGPYLPYDIISTVEQLDKLCKSSLKRAKCVVDFVKNSPDQCEGTSLQWKKEMFESVERMCSADRELKQKIVDISKCTMEKWLDFLPCGISDDISGSETQSEIKEICMNNKKVITCYVKKIGEICGYDRQSVDDVIQKVFLSPKYLMHPLCRVSQ